MAERGQIGGAHLTQSLAFDRVIRCEAAVVKHINSVAGDANILPVPDLEAGNMLAKECSYPASADAAGIVLGAQAAIILRSRADNLRPHGASVATAALEVQAHGGAAAEISSFAGA